MKRTLSLKREALTELGTDQLTAVVGAGVLPTIPVDACLEKFVDTMEPTRCLCP